MEEVFKISPDKERAITLYKRAKERKEIIKIFPKTALFKIVEEYYEILLEQITALMYLGGYKTLSHVSAINYLFENYKEITANEISLIDKLRKLRHGIVYYGEQIKKEFLINQEGSIKELIQKLDKIIEEQIKL